MKFRIFSFVPQLSGRILSPPPHPDARAMFLHNDLLCNDKCSVSGGRIMYWGGGHKRKRSEIHLKKKMKWYYDTNLNDSLKII